MQESPAKTTKLVQTPRRAAVERPAFIVGAVRSGTTLLRLMLDHHPELAFHFEFEFAVDQLSDSGERPALSDYWDYLSRNRIFQLSGGQVDRGLAYDALVNSFLEQKRLRDQKRCVGATVHKHFDRLRYVWPHARYIHLLRDGRDVARSCIAMGWAGNMYFGVDRWIEAEKSWNALKNQIPEADRMEVRYESLIAAPREELTAICEFLGVTFDEAIFDYAESSTYEMPDPKLTEQWRRKLSDAEIQLAESKIAEMLVERGYPLSGLPSIRVSPTEARSLRREDWRRRAGFRAKRYGAPLFALDYAARKLHVGPIARWCRERMNRIDNRHLR